MRPQTEPAERTRIQLSARDAYRLRQRDYARRVRQARRRAHDLRTRHGFTRTHTIGASIFPHCEQCEVLVINGIPCHETGCPNAVHECHGCNALIPVRQRYCEDCL